MTTHDRDKIIAIAEEVKANNDMFGDFSVALYAIAFEDGRKAEREECVNVCIHNASDYSGFNREPYESMEIGALSCAFSIRARGDTK